MKCPKCGYISFDYNQVCPKCNKNISYEQEKLNLPSFRPDPPSLLGFLIGDANESNINLRVNSDSNIDLSNEADIDLNDSVILDTDNMSLNDQDIEMSFDTEDSGEYLFDQESVVEPGKILSDSDFSLEEKEGDEFVLAPEAGEGEELSLDLGELSIEEPGEALDGLSLNDSEIRQETSAEGSDHESDISIDSLDSLPFGIEKAGDEIESEIELNLNDLKINETGELEIGADFKLPDEELEITLVEPEAGALKEEIEPEGLSLDASASSEDLSLDLSDLMSDEIDSDDTEKTMILDDFSLDASDSGETEIEFNMDDGFIESGSGEEEEALDLEGFTLDDVDSGDTEKTMDLDDLSMNDSGEIERMFEIGDLSLEQSSGEDAEKIKSEKSASDSDDLELDGLLLDVEDDQKGSGQGEDDFMLELDDLDIDLDLDGPKK